MKKNSDPKSIIKAILKKYKDEPRLNERKAYALFWIIIIATIILFIPMLINIIYPYEHSTYINIMGITTLTAHGITFYLLNKGRYNYSVNILVVVYTIIWIIGLYLKFNGFLETGINSFLFLVFVIVGLSGLFCSRRVFTIITAILLINVLFLAIAAKIGSSPRLFPLIRTQIMNIIVSIIATYTMFYLIKKLTDSAISTTEDELDKNLEIMKALELQIQERTEQLLTEKNKLKERNNDFERELHMACKIQMNLIPSEQPTDYIYTFYKPMHMVGGDFFDFLRFRNSSKIGIFLSDVAGHGVPAAFVTSMIKSFILQSGARREDPAQLLMYLNSLLFNQTAEYFVTAFYGIYDPDTRHFLYASAGHNFPFLIYKDHIEMMECKQSIPLAIVDSVELLEWNKRIENNEMIVDDNCKMLLYTDGLLEERNNENKQFQHGPLNDVLLESRDLGKEKFIENLHSKLIEYTNSESFYDDICIIYLDI